MQTAAYIFFILAVALLFFWQVIFLRNPKRKPPAGNNVLAPADGTVIEILEYSKNEVELYKKNRRYRGLIKTSTDDVANSGYIVSIFMTPMNVHRNRAPITGEVQKVKHSKGKFLPVNSFEAGLVNEKSETVIKGKITVKMIQIAGFLARRIETHVKAGDAVAAGQLVGLINLGSQVTVVMPKSVKLKIAKGDRTVAGETILAKINS